VSSMDIHIISERVAEVVNRRLVAIDKRISELESKVSKLELDTATLRSQTIESVVRSVLTVKMEELAAIMAVKMSTSFKDSINEVSMAVKNLEGVASEIKNVARQLDSLKALPEKIAEAITSSKPMVQVDTSGLEAAISTSMSKFMKNVEELSNRVASLEKQVAELATNMTRLSESLTVLTQVVSGLESLRKSIEEMRESVDYVKDVTSMLESELRRGGSGGGEEEEEEEPG